MTNWIRCVKCNYKYKDFISACPKCNEKPKSLDKNKQKNNLQCSRFLVNNNKGRKKILIAICM